MIFANNSQIFVDISFLLFFLLENILLYLIKNFRNCYYHKKNVTFCKPWNMFIWSWFKPSNKLITFFILVFKGDCTYHPPIYSIYNNLNITARVPVTVEVTCNGAALDTLIESKQNNYNRGGMFQILVFSFCLSTIESDAHTVIAKSFFFKTRSVRIATTKQGGFFMY